MENVPYIGGLPLLVWFGIVGMGFLIFQILSGLRIIKINPKVHKVCGLLLFCIAIIHGLFGLAFFFN